MSSENGKKLACLVCRQRKVACDRSKPRCGLCEKNGFDCEYRPRDHRPGLRAGYVTQLERRVEHLERRMNDVVSRMSRDSSQNDAEMDLVSPSTPQPLTQSDHDTLGPLNSPPSDVHVHPEAETQLSQIQSAPPLDWVSHDVWMQKYQHWFPILHRTSVNNSFCRREGLHKAIMAITMWDMVSMPWDWRQTRSHKLCQEVILDAMTAVNLRSIQSLLILSIHFWGEGKWSEYSSTIAICKRMSEQLGLAATSAADGAQSPKTSLQPDENFAINAEVEREEAMRAFWMIEMLDSIFALGVSSQVSIPAVPRNTRLPCGDKLWESEDFFQQEPSHQNPQYSSGFSMCISLCTTELGTVNRFQQTVRDSNEIAGGLEWQSAAQRLDERLTIWREEFVAAVFRLINTEFPGDSHAEMEPFIVLTNCLLNMGLISLLQSQSSMPEGVGPGSDPWPYADHRCQYACENMAAKVRRMKEDELKNCSPCLILPMFIAARFYIVHTKCLRADVSVNLHSLAFGLHICSERWELAKLFELVIRTAVAEHRTPIIESALPREFYDLQFSVLDLSPLLQNWADKISSAIPCHV